MHRIKMGNIPKMFHEAIKKQNDKDPTMFFNFNISIKKHFIKSTKYLDLYREPTL